MYLSSQLQELPLSYLYVGIKVMETICDHDDRFNSFIIFFAVSAGINLLLVAVITLTCLVLKQKKNKPVLTSYRYII